jgi:cytochrome b
VRLVRLRVLRRRARIVWGFIGTTHARFADFVPSTAGVRAHVAGILAGRAPRHDGHNPLGALMVLALLAMVLCVGLTGWLQTLDAFWGESWVEELHEGAAGTLVALAAFHAGAAIVMARLERTRLVRAMFTGIKELW